MVYRCRMLRKPSPPAPWTALLVLLPAAASAQQETVRLDVTADNSIIDVRSERDFNMGATSGIRVKSYQHHLILKVDTAPLAGRTVTSARLRYAQRDHALRRVTISTIQADWEEGTGTTFAETFGGSTYNEAVHGATPAESRPWAWPGSAFPDVVYGNSVSLLGESDCPVVDGFYDWEVSPDLVHANAVGAAFGLAVFESENDVSRNPTVYSREQGNQQPYLEVALGPAVAAPPAPGDLRARPELAARGEVVLTFTAPERAFAYRVLVDSVPVPRYLVPFAGAPGSTETIRLRDVLAPGAAMAVEVSAVSRSGAEGPAASVDAAASDREPVPHADLAPVDGPVAGDKASGGGLLVWAAPETDRIRPDGSFLDPVPEGYAEANGRFCGGRITLAAARNETVAFVLVLEAEGAPVRGLDLEVTAPQGWRTRTQALRSVNTSAGPIPEVLLGEEGTAIGPTLAGLATDGDPGAPAARVQLVLVEIDVPPDAAATDHEGAVTLGGGASVTLPLDLHVHDFGLPDAPTFHMDLNTYGWPSYWATLSAELRLSRRFRSNVNTVPYGHGGRTRMDMYRPDGRLMDEAGYNDIQPGAQHGNWEPDFVEAFDDFLTGAAFGPPWEGTPLRSFYLTFHENWPLQMREHRRGQEMDAFAAFPDTYGQTFTAILADFAALAERQGWLGTQFHVYLNNKPGEHNPTPWTLDEPSSYWDFRALAYYNSLLDAAGVEGGPVDIPFRVDISRPQYHRGYLDGVDLYVCAGGPFWSHARIVSDQRERVGYELWTYGSAARVPDSMHLDQAWALRTYAAGGNGLVPWQTVGPGDAYLEGVDDGDQRLALLIEAEDSQTPRLYATQRLATYRRAEQDVEYLRLLERRGGYTRGQMARLVGRHLDPGGVAAGRLHYAEYAADLPTDGHTEATFDALRAHVAAAIEALGPGEGEGEGPAEGEGEGPAEGEGEGEGPAEGEGEVPAEGEGEGGVGEGEGGGQPCDPSTRGPSGPGEGCMTTADCRCGLSCVPEGPHMLCRAPAPADPGTPSRSGRDDGCGCRTTGGPGVPALLLLSLLAVLVRRG